MAATKRTSLAPLYALANKPLQSDGRDGRPLGFLSRRPLNGSIVSRTGRAHGTHEMFRLRKGGFTGSLELPRMREAFS